MKKGAKQTLTTTAEEDSKEEGEAQTIILRGLTEEDQFLVAGCTSAKTIMEKLEKRYKQTINKFTVIRELSELKWSASMTAEQFVNRTSDVRRRYKMVDSEVADEVFLIKLITELPSHGGLAPMKAHYEFLMREEDEKNKLKYESVCNQIIAQYEQEEECSRGAAKVSGYDQHVALMNQQPNNCYNCHNQGHFYYECPQPLKEVLKKRLKSRLEHAKERADQRTKRGREQSKVDRLNEQLEHFSLMAFPSQKEDLTWFRLDDGSTDHITPYAEDFIEYTAYEVPRSVSGVSIGKAAGIGKIRVQSEIKNQICEFELKDVLHIESSPYRVLSEIAAEDNGVRFKKEYGNDGTVQLGGYLGGSLKFAASRQLGVRKLYKSTVRVVQPNVSLVADTEWHKRAAHAGYDRLDKTSKCVDGMQIERTHGRKCTCNACLLGRTKKVPHTGSMRKNERDAGCVWHVDVNNMPVPTIEGYRYALHMVDEASNYQRVGFLKHVSAFEVLNALLKAMWEQYDEIGVLPHTIRSDRGGAFISERVKQGLWDECRTKVIYSSPYNHQENGIAERAIGEATSAMRAALQGAGAPDRMWGEALASVIYTSNRLYNRRIRMTPFEGLTGRRPNVSNLREFGCDCNQHIDGGFRNKIQRTSRPMKMVGYGRSSKVYRIANPEYTRVVEDCNVTFVRNESESSSSEDEESDEDHGDENGSEDSKPEDGDDDDDADAKGEEKPVLGAEKPVLGAESGEPNDGKEGMSDQQAEESGIDQHDQCTLAAAESGIPREEAEQVNELNEQPQIKERPVEYRIKADSVIVPKKFDDIEENPHADLWYDAADDEVIGWLTKDPWDLIEKPKNSTILRGHWLFSIKSDEDGYVNRFKGRWVVDGSKRDTARYAAMPSAGSLRTLMSFAAREGLSGCVVDVRNAYLNSRLDTEALMYQIAGYEDKQLPFHVCKLKVGAYGLPEAAHLWAEEASKHLESSGLQRCQVDTCIFVAQASKLLVGLHSDDLLIFGDHDPEIDRLKKSIASKWEVVDKGPIKKYLGIDVTYMPESKRMYLNQRSKIDELYAKFKHLCQPKATSIPLPIGTELDLKAEPCVNDYQYKMAIGSVSHIAGHSRPDVMLPVNRLAKRMRNPTEHHMNQLLRLIRFLYGTRTTALKFSRDQDETMTTKCYTDAGSKFVLEDEGKHMSGVVVFVGGNAVHWSARRQLIVSNDICEVELYALNLGLKASLPFRDLLKEIGVIGKEEEVINMFCDNEGALGIARSDVRTTKSRHYMITLFYLRDFVKRGEIRLESVRSAENPADMFTKFSDYTNYKPLCKLMKLVDAVNFYKSS